MLMDENELKPIEQITNRFLSEKRDDEHSNAVKAQVRFAHEIFDGIATLCVAENGLSAEALLRTLFDCIINAVLLAKRPAQLQDFVDHARWNKLVIIEATKPLEPLEQERQLIIDSNKGEIQKLQAKFKSTDTQSSKWHRLKTVAAMKDTGLSERMNLIYYKRASNIAHGEPFVTVQPANKEWTKWKISIPEATWKKYEATSFTQARILMVFMFSVLNEQLKLGYDEELTALAKWTESIKQKQIETYVQNFEKRKQSAKDT
jgi:hypothetical protein